MVLKVSWNDIRYCNADICWSRRCGVEIWRYNRSSCQFFVDYLGERAGLLRLFFVFACLCLFLFSFCLRKKMH